MRLFVAVVFAPAFAVASTAALAESQRFIGWHESGDVSYLSVVTEAGKPPVVRVCRVNGDDVPAAWPPALAVGPGVLCADLSDEAAGAAAGDFAKHETATNKPQRSSPFGLKVELAVDGTKHTVTVSDGPEKKLALPVVESAEPLKLGEVLWRKDGGSVAVALEPAKKPDKGALANRVVVVADTTSLLVGGPAGRKVAQAKEKQAAALLKKREWSDAGRVLDEAIAADPTYAPVRYQRAAAEAQGGIGRTAMIENLTWLKASTDPTAKKLLEAAKKDRVFDAWAGEPEVRELLGLPAVSTMDVPARLLERTASWTLPGATCKAPWLTLVFGKATAKGGKGTLEIAQSCKGKKTKSKQAFTWEQTAAGSYDVVTKAVEVGGVKIPARSTLVLDDSYQQLKLRPAGEGVDADIEALGNFEPGVAHVDDSML
jgi:hypothetical protein